MNKPAKYKVLLRNDYLNPWHISALILAACLIILGLSSVLDPQTEKDKEKELVSTPEATAFVNRE